MKESQKLLLSMTRIRMVEEEIARRYSEQQMRCPVHLSIGQEGTAVGVCAGIEQTDWVFSGHRNHAHYLAKGGNLQAMITEIYGKKSGCCGGKGGSMHLTDKNAGFIGATPIVGSTVPIAVGAALTAKREGKSRIVVVFLGDGAMEAGVIHESLNFASLKKLPIVFACENNLYSVYSPLNVRQPAGRSISDLAASHGMKTVKADGNDVLDVYRKTHEELEDVRQGRGPLFMELPTYRWREHCGPGYDNDIGYRTEKEYVEWKKRDPIKVCSEKSGIKLESKEIESIKREINSAFSEAISEDFADLNSIDSYVYAVNEERNTRVPARGNRRITYAEAVREAQDICLSEHQECYLMGLGVPDPKGIFGTTIGLQDKHGAERVFDTPLSENAMTGVAIGSSITGLRPILTHQRLDFALVSIDQIVNQAAKWSYMFNGTMRVPIVIRMIIGRGWGQGPQHSQSLQAWFAHIPGLKVVMPSTPYDAKGAMIAAIEDNNPVLILEHRWLHGTSDLVPEGYYRLPLSQSKVIREGSDLTIVSSSYMTLECCRAAAILEKYNIKVEIVDLLTIRPIDETTILSSVHKTKRVMVVDQADPSCSVASEVITIIAEKELHNLKCNPVRLCLPRHPVPTSHKLAENYYPTADEIIHKTIEMLGSNIKIKTNDIQRSKDQPHKLFNGPF